MQSPKGEPIVGQRTGGAWEFTLTRPDLWWPVGHGPQGPRPLYTLDVQVSSRGTLLDRATRRIGIRTTELITTPDTAPGPDAVQGARGERMELRITGKPVYCKGANWIPDDCFPHRVSRQRYEARIRQALSANMNMLRVWGGGLFETDEFYDLCDELGMLVWQDFPFACSTYPETPEYKRLVELEARDNVARLASHPSLVLYNGGNENIVATYDWAPEFRKIREEGKKPWGLGYWLDLLPRIVAELDPTRPYWPNSPYSGSMDRHPNANEYGNRHMWDVWHGDGQYRNYLGHFPRMATEFGYHAPPNYATLARAIPPEQRYWNSPLLLLHNKNYQDGQKQTTTRLADDFTPPPPTTADFDAWHYLAQTMQARALSMGIEWFRALYPWNTASLYWQFNDCWPVSSWSAVDGDGRAKPLLHATRRFFAPRLLTIKPRRATPGNAKVTELCAYLHNDTDEPWSAPVTVREVNLHGDTLASVTQNVQVAPRTLARFAIPANLLTRDTSFLVASTPGADRAFWWFSPDKLLSYPTPRFDAELVRTGDHTYRFTLTAHTLLRDLAIQPDRIHPAATISDSHVTLLPGDRHAFTLTSPVPLAAHQLVAKPVLWCANQFGASTSR
jgi:beta-mannosidase